MKKLFILIGVLFPVMLFAAGVGGGGSWSATSNIGEGFLAPSVGSVPPPVTPAPTSVAPEQKKELATSLSSGLPPLRTHFCYTLPLLKQRVECRLGLSEQDLAAEYAKQYLPEECRALPKKKQADCVTRYKALQPCWEKDLGEERAICAREVLGIADDIPTVRKSCVALPKKEQSQCLTSLRQQAYNLVKFRFYELNERVENFLKEHDTIDGRAGIQFIVTSELNKQKFNNTRSKAQRLQIIKNERVGWKQTVRALGIDDTRDFLDAATDDLSAVE